MNTEHRRVDCRGTPLTNWLRLNQYLLTSSVSMSVQFCRAIQFAPVVLLISLFLLWLLYCAYLYCCVYCRVLVASFISKPHGCYDGKSGAHSCPKKYVNLWIRAVRFCARHKSLIELRRLAIFIVFFHWRLFTKSIRCFHSWVLKHVECTRNDLLYGTCSCKEWDRFVRG